VIEDALVIVPAYNEAAVIGETIREARRSAAAVLVVDDGSDDGTAEAARAAGADCLRLATNLHYGGALQAGFRYGLKHTEFPYLVTFDADGQHDPLYLEAMLEPLRSGRADYVLGSRFLERAAGRRQPRDGVGEGAPPARGMSLSRALGIRLFARLTSLLLGKRITDPTSGLTAMSREVARVFLLELFPQDFPDADVIIMLDRMGLRVAEVPVAMRPSRSGKSMHGGILRPLYYIAKMSVSMIHLATRRDLKARRKEAELAA